MQQQIAQFLKDLHVQPFVWNIILIAIAIVAGLLIKLLISLFVKKKTKDAGRFNFFYSFFRHLGKPLNYFFPLFLFNILLPLMQLPAAVRASLNHIVQIGLIITFSWLLIQCVYLVQDYVFFKYDLKKSDNFRERKIRTQLQYVRQVVIGLIIILAIASALLTFSTMRQLGTGLLTGVGIGGIIIGFAAQRSLGNLLAGFQIAFTQPIRIDDAVIVENEYGRIEEITLTYVVVKIWDERRLILPITYFIEKPFQNWTRTTTELLGTVFIYADYTIPIEPLRNELNRLMKESPLWNGKAVGLVVTDAKERTVEIRAMVSANDSGKLFDLRCYARENLLKFINEHYADHLPKVRAELEPIAGMKHEPAS